jgi:coenzyme F420-0:L-glutamate ligase
VIGGTGALGRALTLRLALAGHEVWIGSRDPVKAAAAAVEVAAHIGGRVQGASIAEAGAAGAAAVETAHALGPEVRVVSALQTIGAEKLAAGAPIDADVLVAGDDAEAVETVRQILGEMGLRSWHVEIMRTAPGVVIARRRGGQVLANAGIDASNVPAAEEGGETVVLWPADPDASARALRAALQSRFGARIAVIVSDSVGRAWRMGTTGHAIGVAGMRPLRDRRGETDLFGRVLRATVIGVADEIAAAASLVIDEVDASEAEGLRANALQALVTGTVVHSGEDRVRLAREARDFAEGLKVAA